MKTFQPALIAAGLAAILAAGTVNAADAPTGVQAVSPEQNRERAATMTEQTGNIYGIPARVNRAERPRASLKSRSESSNDAVVADAEITQQVVAALSSDSKIKGDIDVSTLDGVVRLIGSVDSVAMIYRVIEVTERIGGVRGVDEERLIKGYSRG